MNRKILLIIMSLWLIAPVVKAQDTTWVQTLTFDSITARRGIWQFPEEGNWRKILMYYTLKCDYATTQDPYACGEWDYLTYSKVHYHTGTLDSTQYTQPSYTFLSGKTNDSLLIRSEPTYTHRQSTLNYKVYEDTISLNQNIIGDGNQHNQLMLQASQTDGHSQYLWKREELTAQGLNAGEITGIRLDISTPGASFDQLMVMGSLTDSTELSPSHTIHGFDTLFHAPLQCNNTGWVNLNFSKPFTWDGTSNIALDFSYHNQTAGNDVILTADNTTWNSGITTHATNSAIDLDGESDYIDLPDGVYFTGNCTVEAWLYKRSDNNWSRFIDFGNGPGNENIIMALSKGTSGKLSFHVYQGDQSKGFETNAVLPTNQWVHVAFTITMNKIGKVYINGQLDRYGLLKQPNDIIRTHNFIGKSNWDSDGYADVIMDEFRIYSRELSPSEISEGMCQRLTAPQANEDLVVSYPFDEGSGTVVHDESVNATHAQCFGYPSWYTMKGRELFLDFVQDNQRPRVSFDQITFNNSHLVSSVVRDSTLDAATQIVLFEDSDNPTIPIDTISTYLGGWKYITENGIVKDSVLYAHESVMKKEAIIYYGEPFEVIDPFEIARYITPYGKGLSLGDNGFTWVYDVTDYADLLKGDVDFSSGNQQELIDVKFAMIEGTAPRKVIQMDRPWGKMKSYYYKNLSDDIDLNETTLAVADGATQFKVTTRLTGHGHNSNNGQYPHCCEWKDNIHYLLVNGTEAASWHIFQYDDCALNPVYPQGGTWNGSREGWCPGDVVKDFEYEITPFVSGNTFTVDYDITKVPTNNQGMGNGNYVTAMHLFQYGPATHSVDAEVYEVVTPNNREYYSRKNPLCSNPTIIIRNNGDAPLNSLTIKYHVSGGEEQSYQWTGSLQPNHKELVTLPLTNNSFWLGDPDHEFSVTISEPNGVTDQYSDNDTFKTHFKAPDLYSDHFILKFKTNHEASRYNLSISNQHGEVIFSRDELENDTEYADTLKFDDGCYTILLTDQENMGLSYWAYPAQGSGYLRIHDLNDQMIKTFNPDFGHQIRYSFSYGENSAIEENNITNLIKLYPNPAHDQLHLLCEPLNGKSTITITNLEGKIVYQLDDQINESQEYLIPLNGMPAGIYLMKVVSPSVTITKKFIKN